MIYEYKQMQFRAEINALRLKLSEAEKNISDSDLMDRILKKIGAEGWNILTVNGDVILQRVKA